MDATLRIVTSLPLRELSRDDGFSSSARGAASSTSEVRSLLCAGPVHFVIAAVGKSPHWIAPRESQAYWKSEVQPHLASPDSKIYLDDFPDGYAYFATRWGEEQELPIVVLEKHH